MTTSIPADTLHAAGTHDTGDLHRTGGATGEGTPHRGTVDSPIGTIRVTVVDGAVVHLDVLDAPVAPPDAASSDPVLTAATTQLREYLAGERTEFDLPLRLEGTPFQEEVWAELRRIPFGETISYRELAERVGRPGAQRAVGSANGRNPVAIVVPCHRVIASDGGLGGYGFGVDRKAWLLALERGR